MVPELEGEAEGKGGEQGAGCEKNVDVFHESEKKVKRMFFTKAGADLQAAIRTRRENESRFVR